MFRAIDGGAVVGCLCFRVPVGYGQRRFFGVSEARREETYLRAYDALVDQVFRQPFHHLDLLLAGQALYRHLDDAADTGLIYGDEALVIHEGKEPHSG